MEKRTFVITGENGQPVAVINAENPQELNEKITASLVEEYDGSKPEYRHIFDPKTVFDSWEGNDLIVHIHDEDELPEEPSFYVENLSIQRCVSF